ncbi:glycosyl transferase family 2 [Opitutaceae bacterium EW11]|nr:glycosyl transferase family 2 [Opitutaceae bacterium EW11]
MCLAPAVSVVLPVRDAVATLDRAIASIVRQTFQKWEMLVVDDGSTDGSREVAAKWACADLRIRTLDAPARGIVAALNAGLDAARAPVIARMDADDESLPVRLEEQLRVLAAETDLGLVGCRVRFGGDAARQAGYALHVAWLNSLTTSEHIRVNRFVESPFAHPGVMFRRSCADRFGGYRHGDFPEDYELWLRWLEAGVRMRNLQRELLVWHDPPGRLSRTDSRYSPDAFYRLKARYAASEVAKLLIDGRPARRRLWIWGAGRPTRKRASLLEEHGVSIYGYVDIDPKKYDRRLGERPVVSEKALPSPREAVVLGYVGSRGARELTRTRLTAAGFVEGADFLMCS